MHIAGTLIGTMGAYRTMWDSIPSSVVSTAAVSLCLALALALWMSHGKRPVYLLDFYCFQPPAHLQASVPQFVDGMRRSGRWTEQSLDFMDKITSISDLGPRTYFPEGGISWSLHVQQMTWS